MEKRKVFIGSSTNGLKLARAVKKQLESRISCEIDCKVWDESGVFDFSFSAVDSLYSVLEDIKRTEGYAILLFTPDDEVELNKGVKPTGDRVISPRDNVVFELGFFLGGCGRKRVVCFFPENYNMRILSDWKGITNILYRYQTNHLEKAVMDAVCRVIDTTDIGKERSICLCQSKIQSKAHRKFSHL